MISMWFKFMQLPLSTLRNVIGAPVEYTKFRFRGLRIEPWAEETAVSLESMRSRYRVLPTKRRFTRTSVVGRASMMVTYNIRL